jgi:hypothetical protein
LRSFWILSSGGEGMLAVLPPYCIIFDSALRGLELGVSSDEFWFDAKKM